MQTHLYYHFWSMADLSFTFNKENECCYNTRENDLQFVRFYKHKRISSVSGNNEVFTFELLSIYLNITYVNMNEYSNYVNALIWANHTIEVLTEFGEDYNFLTEKIGEFLNVFKPNNKIRVKSEENGVLYNRLLERDNNFFTNLITINVNIINKLTDSMINKSIDNNVDEKDGSQIIFLKIKVYVLLELLKKVGVTRIKYKIEDINKLISNLTGNNVDKIKHIESDGISFSKKTHLVQINEMNQLLTDLGLDIKLSISGI